MSSPVESAARAAQDSVAFRALARLGFAVNGLMHIIIGVIAIGVASGAGGSADQSGALGQIAGTPGGTVILWVTAVGLAALGIWLIVSAVRYPSRNKKKKASELVTGLAKGVAYLAIGGAAVTFASGGSTDGESAIDTLSAALIAAPGGIIVLWALALTVVGIGGFFIVTGARRRFIDDITLPAGKPGRSIILLGVIGYVAKGIALAFTGVLLSIAAATADPSQAAGLDGSLKALAGLPLGRVILILIGLGFVAYGIYCFVLARIARLRG
ncbi:hypothetical protein GCM10007382_13630 [Salinibacterium xinjiangense]|uniref:DUF1206 domain-containing protein n=1 Tax=Salinibacterium xinjiangense TaxID=386302 RepID=A0A2C8Y5R1_9MICO|nr:DUF1206 domain-containing protein [Salinibacterium xinjiangense]GGK94650.1 hypothetical protein GCM10007382_13630 [Salinibacterium xinjiangense]SOE45475.1 protein of unknown function [Salinibacterium xinjiangense]